MKEQKKIALFLLIYDEKINNQIIKIPILEPNSFGTKYESIGTTYQTNLQFAKTIIEKIESYNTI